MKSPLLRFVLPISLLMGCQPAGPAAPSIVGTWRLISGTTITKGVSSVTDYTKDVSFIKIINEDHFAFLKHDVNPPKDSANHFDAGGGSYTLKGDQYVEHLEYYSNHNWEAQIFTFTVTVTGDSLVQRGMEKVENENVDREIIERYVRVKK